MARKQTYIVKCDNNGCKAMAEVLDPNEAPEGWVLVQVAQPDQKLGFKFARESAKEFHSLRCLENWAKNRRKFLASEGKPTEGESNEEKSSHGGHRASDPDKYLHLLPPQPEGLKGQEVLMWRKREEAKIVRGLMLDALKELGEPVTVNSLAILVDIAESSSRRHLEQMVEEGIVKTEPGPRGAVLYSLL